MPFDALACLTKRQQDGIVALMDTTGVAEAAKKSGIGKRTFFKWLQREDFKAGYRQARYIVMEDAFSTMQKACTEAADTILTIMRDEDAPHHTRLLAAQSIIDLANKSRTVDELEARIAALEGREPEPTAEAT